MQTTAWPCIEKTGGSGLIPSRSGSVGVAAAVAFAFLAGTGGVTTPSYFAERQDRGYAFVQVRPSGRILGRHLRTPQENIAHVRALFKPSMADIASVFKVSRQSVYNWIAGEKPSQESVERLDDLARAADLFMADGGGNLSYLIRRKLENGKTLLDIVREGGSAQDAARSLLQMAQKETSQRQALQRRLANRPAPREYFDLGSPMLNEDLG
jgi:transcriptional regulator with XRE-family HTH domain